VPVIRVAKWDLDRLVGRDLSYAEIAYLLPKLKCEIESFEHGEIEYEATHDRPDLYSVEGLARGIKYLLGIPSKQFSFIDNRYKAYNLGVPKRPYVAFAIVRDVELDDEAVKQIMQLQEKLATTYGRNRRKASIGVYDLDSFSMPVFYELRDPSTTRFTPLNERNDMDLREILVETEKGRIYGWIISSWEKYPVIRDKHGKILSLVPVINSDDTKVTEETRNILIDSTGTDPSIVIDMVTVMATSIAERSNNKEIYFVDAVMPSGEVIRAPRHKGKVIEVSIDNINSLLGLNLSTSNLKTLLTKLGYKSVEIRNKTIVVEAPPYRIDLKNWVDVAEDIAIAYGYELLGREANELPPATHPGRLHPIEYLSKMFRKLLVGYGYIEVANYMMSNPDTQFRLFNIQGNMIKVSNPKMEKYTGLRVWLTPGLLEVIKKNSGKEHYIRIFEVGDVVIPNPSSETGARTERKLGIAISHGKATLTDGLALVVALFELIGLKPSFRRKAIEGLLPERSAEIVVIGKNVGFLGEVHPQVLRRLKIDNPVVVIEVSLNSLLDLITL